MVEPIKITTEMQNAKQERIDQTVRTQNTLIHSAILNNKTSCVFYLDKDNEIYIEVRAIFERAGYKIKPTGYIGGVWQLTEDICW